MARDWKATQRDAMRNLEHDARTVAAGVLRALPFVDVPKWDKAKWDDSYNAGRWDRLARLPEAARYSILAGYLRFFGAKGGFEVLDVGSGEGLLFQAMQNLPLGRFVGTDISEVAVERATERFASDTRASFHCTDQIPIDLGQFDVVVFNEVLYLAAHPAQLVDQARRVVKPGGFVLASVWRHVGERKIWGLFDEVRFERVDMLDFIDRMPGGPRIRIALFRPR